MTYELSVVHRREAPHHGEALLSSKLFCSEQKIIKLAQIHNKVIYINGNPAVETPYKKRKRFRGYKNTLGVRKIFFTDFDMSDEGKDSPKAKLASSPQIQTPNSNLI
jgi:hypothetical protein